jgi:peptide/nickel transport system substrate-binding protein
MSRGVSDPRAGTPCCSPPEAFEGSSEDGRSAAGVEPSPGAASPLAFVEAEPGARLVLERRDDHFLTGEPDGIPGRFHGGPAYGRLELEWVMSDVAAVERVARDLADATVSNLGPDTVPRIGREGGIQLESRRSSGFYHVGFNSRRAPLSNPQFRRVAARLLDKASIVESAFRGYATPAATPLATSAWAAPSLAWDGGDPSVPFLGSDGSVDVAAAREAFREAGYRYDDRDRLLVREP